MSIRPMIDHAIGGTLTIPDGYYVQYVNLDVSEPYCEIISTDYNSNEVIKLNIPKSLAYYLTTHHIGSDQMELELKRKFQNELKRIFKNLLEIV